MNRQKQKLTSNAELTLTCSITLALNAFSYFLVVLVNSENRDKMEILIDFFQDFGTYKVLSDCLPSCLIIWCIIGLINKISKSSRIKLSTKFSTVAMLSIFGYCAWYILYALYNEYLWAIIVNFIVFAIELVLLFIFFYERKRN